MEIEKKYLIHSVPNNLSTYNKATLKQGYISTDPVIRIRQKNKTFYLTVKSKGLLAREEFEIEISEQQFNDLLLKIDYNLITKERYFIPYHNYTIELDIFNGLLKGLIVAEVEFQTLEDANVFTPPDWFSEEVTQNPQYQNNQLCKKSSYAALFSPEKTSSLGK